MAAAHGHRFRDGFAKHTPWWLSDRRAEGRTVGYRMLWAMIAPLDALFCVLLQGLYAWLPGFGTPTALPWIGRSRGIIRWQDESDADYAARLRAWWDTRKGEGRTLELAKQIHGYLRTKPRVRVITRAGAWITVATDGTVTRHTATWDWDSVSHPERNTPGAPWWSDLFVVVQPSQWTKRAGTLGGITADGYALGHLATREEIEAIKGLIAQFKGAHARVRAVIFTSDATLFDPTVPASCPDGTWGAWGTTGSGSRVKSGRELSTCRFWEPR